MQDVFCDILSDLDVSQQDHFDTQISHQFQHQIVNEHNEVIRNTSSFGPNQSIPQCDASGIISNSVDQIHLHPPLLRQDPHIHMDNLSEVYSHIGYIPTSAYNNTDFVYYPLDKMHLVSPMHYLNGIYGQLASTEMDTNMCSNSNISCNELPPNKGKCNKTSNIKKRKKERSLISVPSIALDTSSSTNLVELPGKSKECRNKIKKNSRTRTRGCNMKWCPVSEITHNYDSTFSSDLSDTHQHVHVVKTEEEREEREHLVHSGACSGSHVLASRTMSNSSDSSCLNINVSFPTSLTLCHQKRQAECKFQQQQQHMLKYENSDETKTLVPLHQAQAYDFHINQMDCIDLMDRTPPVQMNTRHCSNVRVDEGVSKQTVELNAMNSIADNVPPNGVGGHIDDVGYERKVKNIFNNYKDDNDDVDNMNTYNNNNIESKNICNARKLSTAKRVRINGKFKKCQINWVSITSAASCPP